MLTSKTKLNIKMITTFRILLLSLYPIIVFIIILEELLLHILSFLKNIVKQ